jgi:predicted double-glycine peptidase
MPTRYHPISEKAVRIPLPDVRQKTDWSCGASALQAVAGYFGVGPPEEQDFAKDMQVDPRVGTHPHQIESAARAYGLKVHSHVGMRDEELKSYLDQGKPVLLMIQAWGDPQVFTGDDTYEGVWKEGHWVVAIGYDQEGYFFEDPVLAVIRGYLSYDALSKRWRDTGPHGRHISRLGIVIWMECEDAPAYLRRAAHID